MELTKPPQLCLFRSRVILFTQKWIYLLSEKQKCHTHLQEVELDGFQHKKKKPEWNLLTWMDEMEEAAVCRWKSRNTKFPWIHLGQRASGNQKSGVWNKNGVYFANNESITQLEVWNSPSPLRDLTVLRVHGQKCKMEQKDCLKHIRLKIRHSNEIIKIKHEIALCVGEVAVVVMV